MNELIEYDLYKRPNGLLYRVSLHSSLHERAELYSDYNRRWKRSEHTIGAVISSSTSTLVARNVVFKD